MGCDIHLYVETRRADGTWVSADKWSADKYENDPQAAKVVEYDDRFYSGRNYDLFAMLADVRNGRGFAGIKTGDGFEPISAPRGVPDDCSTEYRAAVDRWDCDGHSHSYLTVAELLAYDWTQTARKCGWVTPTEWARFRDYGRPDGWCGDVGGGEVRHLSAEDFENAWQTLRDERGYPEQRYASAHLNAHRDGCDIARMVEILGGGSPYCQVEWTVPYYDSASEFLGKCLPRLLRLGSHDDVRIVFFFDN